MADLTFVTGTSASSGYVRVGHNSSSYNNDAVWSFKLDKVAAALDFTLKWNNTAAGTGWSGSYNYVFAISASGTSGRTAATEPHIAKVTVMLSGSSGTAKVSFVGLTLAANTTYYLRANFNGSTYSTMKAFAIAGNTVTVQKTIDTGAVMININGAWKKGTPYVKVNGVWKKGAAYVKTGGVWRIGV